MEMLHDERIIIRVPLYPLSYSTLSIFTGSNNDVQLIVTNKRLLVCIFGGLLRAARALSLGGLVGGEILDHVNPSKVAHAYLLTDIDKVSLTKGDTCTITLKAGEPVQYSIKWGVGPDSVKYENLHAALTQLPINVECL